MDIRRLESYIQSITDLIYDDLLLDRGLNINFIKIYIGFYDKDNKLIDTYFHSKDNIQKMSKHYYSEYIYNKLFNKTLARVKTDNLSDFELFILYNL